MARRKTSKPGAATGGAQNQRALVMLGAGLALVLVVFVAGKVMGGGGGGSSADVAAGPSPVGAVTPAPSAPSTPSTLPTEPAVEADLGPAKNPFVSKVPGGGGGSSPVAPSAPSAPAPSAPASATTPVVIAPPTAAPTASPAPTAPAPAPAVAATTPVKSPTTNPPRYAKRLTFLAVNGGATPTANLQVDQAIFQGVKPGETFANTYKLVSIDGQCGTFLFGDMRFWMCVGEGAWI